MPKTTFQNGSVVTAEWLNSIQDLNFRGTNTDGSYPPITDEDLTNTPGNLKPEWQAFRDALRVTAGSGLSVSIAGGTVTLPNGTIVPIEPSSLTLPSNTTSIIHVKPNGTIAAGTANNLPLFRLPLAAVTTGGSSITGAIVDLRPRFSILPRTDAIKTFGGLGDQGDYALAAGESAVFADGVYYFNNLTIAGNLTVSQFARIYCAGAATITGTINVTPTVVGGLAFGTGGIPTPNTGGLPGGGIGAGSGSGYGGRTYSYASQPYGSGGAGGYFSSSSTGASGITAAGGEGGGGFWLEAAGPVVVSASATISAIGGDAAPGVLLLGSPYISGGGAGAGGDVILSSLISVSVAGTINVKGGNGSDAVSGDAAGGGGGGGGQFVAIAPLISTDGAIILLAGGRAGNGLGSLSLGGGNGASNGGLGGSSGMNGSIGRAIMRGFRAVG